MAPTPQRRSQSRLIAGGNPGGSDDPDSGYPTVVPRPDDDLDILSESDEAAQEALYRHMTKPTAQDAGDGSFAHADAVSRLLFRKPALLHHGADLGDQPRLELMHGSVGKAKVGEDVTTAGFEVDGFSHELRISKAAVRYREIAYWSSKPRWFSVFAGQRVYRIFMCQFCATEFSTTLGSRRRKTCKPLMFKGK